MSFEMDITAWAGGLDQLTERVAAAAMQGANTWAQGTMARAVDLAPRGGGTHSPNDPAPGTLKDSGVAYPAEINGSIVSVTMGFNTIYAVVQHERLDFGHDEGQAKYLETAVRENLPKGDAIIAAPIRAAMEQGGAGGAGGQE